MIPYQKENQARPANARAKEEGRRQAPIRQRAENKICPNGDTIHNHGMDAERCRPVLRLNLPVLDFRLKWLEQRVGKTQSQDTGDGGGGILGSCQEKTGQRRRDAEKEQGFSSPHPFGNGRGINTQQPQPGGGDVNQANGSAGHSAPRVLQLIQKYGDRLMGLRQKSNRNEEKKQRTIAKDFFQGDFEWLRWDVLRRRALDLCETKGEEGGDAIADHRQKARQCVIVPHHQGKYPGGDQKARHTHAVVDAKGLLAFVSRQVDDAGIHAGKTGKYHAEQNAFHQKACKSGGLPKDDFGDEIQSGAEDHRLFVPDSVGCNPPGHLQQNFQPKGNALNDRNLENSNPLGLAVQGRNGPIKNHALQKRNGIHHI